MKYLSLFSGIEAASVAWQPIGWKAFAFAEIDPFCCTLLKHHYPKVRNLGDVSQVEVKSGQIDVLVGGSPCQSFSVAGKRLGLDDPRGNMALVYLRIVHQALPRWTVFENVPGLLSSSDGDDFTCFLSHFSGWEVRCPKEGWGNAGILSGRNGYGIAWRVLDAQHFGVPQRRRRLFVVGHLGDWRPAAAVLLERESVRWNPPPGKKKGTRVAASLRSRSHGKGVSEPGRGGEDDQNIVFGCLNDNGKAAGSATQQDAESGMLVMQEYTNYVSGGWVESDGTLLSAHEQKNAGTVITHSFRTDGFDASEGGTGRGTPLVADIIGVQMNFIRETQMRDRTGSINSNPGNAQFNGLLDKSRMAVRRLTPRECERLQGFPDDYTLVPYRGKPAADGNRYRALGNSMAVPVMRWIGERITLVDGNSDLRSR